ncbi:hypothetical protein J6590_052385 [Homalodisca vitripennis]|nr:hypothetical protein J6590_052385 [Homalodisca vitripennis]
MTWWRNGEGPGEELVVTLKVVSDPSNKSLQARTKLWRFTLLHQVVFSKERMVICEPFSVTSLKLQSEGYLPNPITTRASCALNITNSCGISRSAKSVKWLPVNSWHNFDELQRIYSGSSTVVSDVAARPGCDTLGTLGTDLTLSPNCARRAARSSRQSLSSVFCDL